MRTNKTVTIILASVFVLGFLLVFNMSKPLPKMLEFPTLRPTPNKNQLDASATDIELKTRLGNLPNPTSIPSSNCTDNDLKVSGLDPLLRDNKEAMRIIRARCFWVRSQSVDLTADGKKEIVLVASGYGCASCRSNNLFIIDGDQVIFEYEGEDLDFIPQESGFQIREPNRMPRVMYSDANGTIVSNYIYSVGGTEIGLGRPEVKFAKTSTYSEKR